MKKFFNTLIGLFLLVMLLSGTKAFATDFIKDVMVIGGSKNEIKNLKETYTAQGWNVIDKDLNDGASGDYIYLLYKKESSNNINWDYITDFMIYNEYYDNITTSNAVYYPLPYDGGNHFKEKHGDLNSNAGGEYIYLYYTKSLFSDHRAVSGITFNTTQNGGVPKMYETTGYDLNEGADGDYIYMHLTITTTHPALSGEGTEGSPFLISSTDDWNSFARIISNGQGDNKYYKLTANISVSTMVGTSEHPFTGLRDGCFDGNGHTINVNINSSESGAAPFHYVNQVKIKDLTVTGTVRGSANHAAGLMGLCSGHNLITNCNVMANVVGSGYAGGIVGHAGSNNMTINGSVYGGNISGFNAYAGGLIGWCDNCTIRIDNSLFKGSFTPSGNGKYHKIGCKSSNYTIITFIGDDVYCINTFNNTASGNYIINGGTKVSPTNIAGSWDLPVVAADGLTYYEYFYGKRLPYSYGFDNGIASEGWYMDNPMGATGIWNNMFNFDHPHEYITESFQSLISPEFNGLDPIYMTFQKAEAFQDYTACYMVGYSTTTKSIGNFVWNSYVNYVDKTTFSTHEETFPKGTKYIAIRFVPNYLHNLRLDNFSFTVCNTPAPVKLVASNITGESATVTWEAPAANATITGYGYQYKKANDANWSAESTVGANATSVTVNGLSGLTDYEFRIRAIYNNEQSIYTKLRFVTLAPLPYECGFEFGMQGWTQGGYTNINTGIRTDYSYEGSHSYRFYQDLGADEAQPQYLISPEFDGTKKKVVSFYHLTINSEELALQIGYSTNTNNPEDFIWVDSFISTVSRWSQYTHTFPTGTKYIVIKHEFLGESLHPIYLDDFSIMEYSAYPMPVNLILSDLTDETATFSWRNPATAIPTYTYQYKKHSDKEWSNEVTFNTSSETPSVTIDNLSANTVYDFRVKSVIGGNSSMYVSLRFTTEGLVETLPHNQDFLDGLGGWRVVANDVKTGISYDDIGFFGVPSFEFYGAGIAGDLKYLFSPRFDGSKAMKLSFYYCIINKDLPAQFQVGYSTTTKDPSAFTWKNIITCTELGWKNFMTYFPQGTKCVAIRSLRGLFLYVDDILLEEAAAINITGYGESTESDHWAFIASPFTDIIFPTDVENLITDPANEYDLFTFDQIQDAAWQNYKAHPRTTYIENGQGYLYARKNSAVLYMGGSLNSNSQMSVELIYYGDVYFEDRPNTNGWNLLGNPFPVDAYSNKVYYKMNDAGSDIEAVANTATAIPPYTGIMVRATDYDQYVTFTRAGARSGDQPESRGCIELTLTKAGTRGNEVHDKAFVSFDEDAQLPKFIFNEKHAKLFIPQYDENYAVAYSDQRGEMPLHFKARENGSYTITFKPEEVEMDYLHLIDNLTGVDIDLLTTPSYTFTARNDDYPSRFKLVFNAQLDGENEDDHFAFVSNGEIIVTGTGTVQVIDMLGRQLFSREVNSSFRIPNSEFTPGVYVLRLIDGEKGRTQKIVVR